MEDGARGKHLPFAIVPSNRVGALDGLRGIAISAVMLLHAAGAYFPGGAVGVDLFFALSAYLITTNLLAERSREGSVSLKTFYKRRAARLGPALLVFLAIVAPVTAVATGNADAIASSTAASLLYIGNYAVAYEFMPVGGEYTHIWSLAIEEQFYLVWPILLVLLLRRPARLATGLGALLAVAVLAQMVTLSLQGGAYFLPWGHGVPILGGCLLAVLLSKDTSRRRVQRALSPTVALGAFGVLGVLVLTFDRLDVGQAAVALTVAGIGSIALVGHAVTQDQSLVAKALSLAPLRWLGARSYGLYLYHRTLAILIPTLAPGITLKVAGPLVLLIAFVFAELSWRLVEQPVIRAARRTRSSQDEPTLRSSQ